MSGETFESKHDENANAPTEQFSWRSDAESLLGCRVALYANEGTADWLRKTLLAVEHSQPCMQSPAKQTVAYFLLGELPTQLEDL